MFTWASAVIDCQCGLLAQDIYNGSVQTQLPQASPTFYLLPTGRAPYLQTLIFTSHRQNRSFRHARQVTYLLVRPLHARQCRLPPAYVRSRITPSQHPDLPFALVRRDPLGRLKRGAGDLAQAPYPGVYSSSDQGTALAGSFDQKATAIVPSIRNLPPAVTPIKSLPSKSGIMDPSTRLPGGEIMCFKETWSSGLFKDFYFDGSYLVL